MNIDFHSHTHTPLFRPLLWNAPMATMIHVISFFFFKLYSVPALAGCHGNATTGRNHVKGGGVEQWSRADSVPLDIEKKSTAKEKKEKKSREEIPYRDGRKFFNRSVFPSRSVVATKLYRNATM